MPTTTYLGLTYPSLSDAPNVPSSMQTLATNADTKLSGVILCTSGTRPTARAGATIFETDTNKYMSYTGSAWVPVGANTVLTYTPTLTATSNPNLGTGGTAEGRYTLFGGKWCALRVTFQWGTSGTAGSGQYLASLPVQASASITNGVSNVGSAFFRDASGVSLLLGICYATASSSNLAFHSTSGGVTGAVPWAWGGSGDYISATLVYETI